MATTLEGKVAIITGAGSGLGEATANELAEAGAAIVAADVRLVEAKRVCSELAKRNRPALPVECDVSDPASIEQMVAATVRQFGRIDVLINNAGIDYTLPIEQLTVEQWDHVHNVNLRALFLCSKAALSYLRQAGNGQIVNIASTAAKRGWANAAAYCASKWGVIGFSRALGVELRPDNIRVSVVVPGGMDTHFFDRLEEPPDPAVLQRPETVARVIRFILEQPPETAIHEVIVTPSSETSWP